MPVHGRDVAVVLSSGQEGHTVAEDDAVGDCCTASGFLPCFEQIAVPFTTGVFGIEVVVTDFKLTDSVTLVAACRRGETAQRIPVLNLPLPTPPPDGHDWIAAYRRWRKGC